MKRKSKTKTITKSVKVKGFAVTSARLRKFLSRTPKTVLFDCFIILFNAAPRKVKLRVAVKIQKSLKAFKTRKTSRKASKRKAPKRKTSKSTKTRTAKQKRADKKNGARLKALSKRRRR